MGDALFSGVSGLMVSQQMLDVAGNNLANVDTTGFKSSRVLFSDLMSQTLQDAGQPTALVGGTNPLQIGSGVQVASIDRDMTEGSMENTGQPLDMAIDGSGFFTVNNGAKDLYTRVGSFAVDSQFYLVDPSTGYRVQRTGNQGVSEGFQTATSDDIRIPYDTALPAQATSTISYSGNLSADDSTATTQSLLSSETFTTSSIAASDSTLLKSLDQAKNLTAGDGITVTATQRDGTVVTSTLTVSNTTTLGDLTNQISTALGGQATVSLVNGQIQVVDNQTGYSQMDVNLSMKSGSTGSLTLPSYFQITSPGGESSKTTNVEVFDSQGVSHTLTAAFVRSSANTWDMEIMSVSGDVTIDKRRIQNIQFQGDGSFGGLGGTTPDTSDFKLTFANSPSNVSDINVNLGTVGQYGGLSQFGGTSTAAAGTQDGTAAGYLTSMDITNDGVLMGTFTNGDRQALASLKITTFQNPSGLEAVGNNYFTSSSNSGAAVPNQAMSGSAGSIQGSSLEKSNVDTATEFVNLIQAQNSYQANAKTIRTANDMLQDLTTLMR